MVLSPGVKCLESEGTSEFFYLPFFFIFLKLSVNLQEYSELPVAHLLKAGHVLWFKFIFSSS